MSAVLDVLLERAPHSGAAASLGASIEAGEGEGLLAARAGTTLRSLATRSGGREFGNRCVADVPSVFSVAPVNAEVLAEALGMDRDDFRRAVCATMALAGTPPGIGWSPEGIQLVRSPPYSPALQPAERVWALIHEVLANRTVPDIDARIPRIGARCNYLTDHPHRVRGRAAYHWRPTDCRTGRES